MSAPASDMPLPDAEGWLSIQSAIDAQAAERLSRVAPVQKLSLTEIPLVTVQQAKRLMHVSVEHLWLWCNVTRRAMRYVVQMPGLHTLDVLHVRGPGAMAGFSRAEHLQVFRSNLGLTEQDLMQVAQCGQLRELGAQNAEISGESLAAILALPQLTTVDLEATRFDNRMAKKLARSQSITSLDLGGTRITGQGLAYLVQMQQLRALDLWATDLSERDLQLLLQLPHLEYLSLGNYYGMPPRNADAITQLILDAPSLKRVWLDGMPLDASQKAALEKKLDSLQLSVG